MYLYIEENTYNNIMDTVGAVSPETGGIVGGNDGVITNFYYDINARNEEYTYTPSLDVNKVIREWSQYGIEFMGIIHSHPVDRQSLSSADIRYAHQIMQLNGLKSIYFPLVIPEVNKMIIYCVDARKAIIEKIFMKK